MSCQILLSVTSMENLTAKSYNRIVTVKCLNAKYQNFIQICTKHTKKEKAEKRQCVKKFLEQFVKYTNQKNIFWNFDFETRIMRCIFSVKNGYYVVSWLTCVTSFLKLTMRNQWPRRGKSSSSALRSSKATLHLQDSWRLKYFTNFPWVEERQKQWDDASPDQTPFTFLTYLHTFSAQRITFVSFISRFFFPLFSIKFL